MDPAALCKQQADLVAADRRVRMLMTNLAKHLASANPTTFPALVAMFYKVVLGRDGGVADLPESMSTPETFRDWLQDPANAGGPLGELIGREPTPLDAEIFGALVRTPKLPAYHRAELNPLLLVDAAGVLDAVTGKLLTAFAGVSLAPYTNPASGIHTVGQLVADPTFDVVFSLYPGAVLAVVFDEREFRNAFRAAFLPKLKTVGGVPAVQTPGRTALNAFSRQLFPESTRGASQSSNSRSFFTSLRAAMTTSGMCREDAKIAAVPSLVPLTGLPAGQLVSFMAPADQAQLPALCIAACNRARTNADHADKTTVTDCENVDPDVISALLVGAGVPKLRYPDVMVPPPDGTTPELHVKNSFTAYLDRLHCQDERNVGHDGVLPADLPDLGHRAVGAALGPVGGPGGPDDLVVTEASRDLFHNKGDTDHYSGPWTLRPELLWNTSGGGYRADFTFSRVIKGTNCVVKWPLLVGEVKALDTTIHKAVTQFHCYAVAVVRALQLVHGLAAACHLGRVVAGGSVQYFVTYFRASDRTYVTAPASPRFDMVLPTTAPEVLYHAIVCWEEATHWLANQQAVNLEHFMILSMKAGSDTDGGGEDDPGRDSDTCVPVWWTPEEAGSHTLDLRTQLSARGYDLDEVIKLSEYCATARCRERMGGATVFAKVYPRPPADALETIRHAHTTAHLPPNTGIVNIVDEFWLPLGYCVMFGALPASSQQELLSFSTTKKREVMETLRKLLDALHDMGVYHGDVHFGNVVCDATSGFVGLVDFDAARVFAGSEVSSVGSGDAAASEWARRDAEGLTRVSKAFGIPV